MHARLFVLLMVLAACSDPEAQIDDRPPHIVAGLNNGMNRIFLQITEDKGKPLCELSFCRLSDEHPALRPMTPPTQMSYRGKKELKSGGDNWTEYSWQASHDRILRICFPIRGIGDRYMAHFAKFGYAVKPGSLPYAMAIVDKGDVSLPYPLRDFSGIRNPREALMTSGVQVESTTNFTALCAHLNRQMDSDDREKILGAIATLKDIPNAHLRACHATLLRLREHKDPQVHMAARNFCSNRHIYSTQDVMAACTDLKSTDPAVLTRAVDLLSSAGPIIWRQGIPALKGFLARADLDPGTRAQAKSAFSEMEARKADLLSRTKKPVPRKKK